MELADSQDDGLGTSSPAPCSRHCHTIPPARSATLCRASLSSRGATPWWWCGRWWYPVRCSWLRPHWHISKPSSGPVCCNQLQVFEESPLREAVISARGARGDLTNRSYIWDSVGGLQEKSSFKMAILDTAIYPCHSHADASINVVAWCY